MRIARRNGRLERVIDTLLLRVDRGLEILRKESLTDYSVAPEKHISHAEKVLTILLNARFRWNIN